MGGEKGMDKYMWQAITVCLAVVCAFIARFVMPKAYKIYWVYLIVVIIAYLIAGRYLWR